MNSSLKVSVHIAKRVNLQPKAPRALQVSKQPDCRFINDLIRKAGPQRSQLPFTDPY
jgi:hypothetical protein